MHRRSTHKCKLGELGTKYSQVLGRIGAQERQAVVAHGRVGLHLAVGLAGTFGLAGTVVLLLAVGLAGTVGYLDAVGLALAFGLLGAVGRCPERSRSSAARPDQRETSRCEASESAEKVPETTQTP